jgi:hypothetical protein
LLIACFFLLAAPGPALAQNADLFVIRDIPLDVEAQTAQQARDNAIAQGEATAVTEMMQRVTVSSDWGKLPQVPSAQVAPLVSSIQIDDEKISAGRYQANMTVDLNPDGIRGLLRRGGIAFSEARYKPMLVLTTYGAGGLASFGLADNPLRQAWIDAADRPGLIPYLLPGLNGVSVDFNAGDTVLSLSDATLVRLRRAAGAGAVLGSRVDLVSAAGETPSIKIRMRDYSAPDAGTFNLTMTAQNDETLDQLMARAVAEMRRDVEDRWKSQTLARFDERGTLTAEVPLTSLDEWREILSRLGDNILIDHVDIVTLTSSKAEIVLHFLGRIPQLQVSLEQDDLTLDQPAAAVPLEGDAATPGAAPAPTPAAGGELWQLTRRGGAG